MKLSNMVAALVAIFLVFAGVVGFASVASADPNNETSLPANGVQAIERSGDTWTVTTTGAPSEVKVMSPDLGPLCGVNYFTLDTTDPRHRPLCTESTTFSAATPCVYVQVDGLTGYNSSDPYVCRGNSSPPSSTEQPVTNPPTATEPPTTSAPPSETPTSPEPSPGITASPDPNPSASAPGSPPPSASSSALPLAAPGFSSPPSLAETGAGPLLPWFVVITAALVLGGAAVFLAWKHRAR